jgi:methylated-DNA-protein-cysteine methyltransferase related protein
MGSPAFARIKLQVLDILARVDEGRLTTFAAVAAELDVPARHVAYVLATLTDQERTEVPWHRALAQHHRPARTPIGRRQRVLLAAEGVGFDASGAVVPGDRFVVVRLDEQHRAHRETPLSRRPD